MFSVLLMFFIQIIVSLTIFIKPLRKVGALFLASLQILIMVTGNYAPFNLLSLGLILLLFEDKDLNFLKLNKNIKTKSESLKSRKIISIILIILLIINIFLFARAFVPPLAGTALVQKSLGVVSPFRTINTYGLFAFMTTKRFEIIIEGSNDEQTWQEYEFKYKPGSLDRIPSQVAPHQPRLDWQMWFAALRYEREKTWFILFVQKLLQGSEPVLKLLEKNPFPDKPPTYIRAVYYEYKFTDKATREQTGNYWQREQIGLYLQSVRLQNTNNSSEDS